MDRDRWIVLRDDGLRIGGNPGTRVLTASELAAARAAPEAPLVQQAFLRAYPVLRERARQFGPGLFALAIDERGVAASVGIAARPDRPVSAIVGRHASTDLHLADDPTLSLRHMAIIVLPRREAGSRGAPGAEAPVRYRLLDLRSGRGFQDEHHHPVQALESTGPLFAYAGRYTLLLHPVTGEERWPEDPEEAWRALPERAYTHQRGGGPPRPRGHTTEVQIVAGPSFAQPDAPDLGRVGMLRVTSTRGASAFTVGMEAARAGVLFGRYDRCDNAGMAVLDDPNISRVHLLVVEVDGALYAIDTASTNGVRTDGTRFRERALGGHDLLELGLGLAEVEWLASH